MPGYSEAERLNQDWKNYKENEGGDAGRTKTHVVDQVAARTSDDDRERAAQVYAQLEPVLNALMTWALTPTQYMREHGMYFGGD